MSNPYQEKVKAAVEFLKEQELIGKREEGALAEKLNFDASSLSAVKNDRHGTHITTGKKIWEQLCKMYSIEYRDGAIRFVNEEVAPTVPIPVTSELQTTLFPAVEAPIPEELQDTWWYIYNLSPKEDLKDIHAHVFHLTNEKISPLKNTYRVSTKTLDIAELSVGTVRKNGDFLIINQWTAQSYKREIHLKVQLPTLYDKIELMIGQVNLLNDTGSITTYTNIFQYIGQGSLTAPPQPKRYTFGSTDYNQLPAALTWYLSDKNRAYLKLPQNIVKDMDSFELMIRELQSKVYEIDKTLKLYLSKNFILYYYDAEKKDSKFIERVFLEIGKVPNQVFIKHFDELAETDYYGTVKIDKAKKLVFDLKNEEGEEKELHIKMNIGVGRVYAYAVGACLNLGNSKGIEARTLVMQYTEQPFSDLKNEIFKIDQLDQHIIQFLMVPDNNRINIPVKPIRNLTDFATFFEKQQQKMPHAKYKGSQEVERAPQQTSLLMTDIFHDLKHPIPKAFENTWWYWYASSKRRKINRYICHFSSEKYGTFHKVTTEVCNTQQRENYIGYAYSDKNKDFIMIEQMTEESKKKYVHVKFKVNYAGRPDLMFGQANLISDGNNVVSYIEVLQFVGKGERPKDMIAKCYEPGAADEVELPAALRWYFSEPRRVFIELPSPVINTSAQFEAYVQEEMQKTGFSPTLKTYYGDFWLYYQYMNDYDNLKLDEFQLSIRESVTSSTLSHSDGRILKGRNLMYHNALATLLFESDDKSKLITVQFTAADDFRPNTECLTGLVTGTRQKSVEQIAYICLIVPQHVVDFKRRDDPRVQRFFSNQVGFQLKILPPKMLRLDNI